MKHLKTYKVFENITIHTLYRSVMDKYLNELGTSESELSDIFRDVLDLDYKSYLQLFYLDKNGGRWSKLPDILGENHPMIPFLSISFEKDSVEEVTIKSNSGAYGIVYSKETDSIVAFTDSILRLKSMYEDKEIYWKFKPTQMEVCIYFDPITENDNTDL